MKSDVDSGLELNFLMKKANVNLLWRDPGVYASLNSTEKCRNNREPRSRMHCEQDKKTNAEECLSTRVEENLIP